ncbi:DUF1684 domain-containing protein [Mariniflexile sp. AS56]|uniref:DUF1684 domain-containing protein n=1 Tax=Mariniflexile sp. AS56 TaxID=3063957 RepID=UPI0026EEB900|nr:DUF1684 domain-containing protein [Mariniflexile sp. AS56]MDO7171463.1 DUF1684 domain-containing protein [Mariniflexile sp. AS56]
MKFLVTLLVFIVCVVSCAQEKRAIQGDTDFQRELNAEYKDATTSPLKDKDRKHFEGLDFFKFDASYVVTATLERTPNTAYFNMKTTTDRVSKERIFGVLTFELRGISYQLNVYQGKDIMLREGFEDYLFLPFLDETNGLESYGGGRYIDARIPDGDTMEIDFNKSYNPYCAYNDKYSCPIVPRENYLETRIEAGVKAFGEH